MSIDFLLVYCPVHTNDGESFFKSVKTIVINGIFKSKIVRFIIYLL